MITVTNGRPHMLDITATRELIKSGNRPRSAWDRGVAQYVEDFLLWLEDYQTDERPVERLEQLLPVLLNGARDWRQYSEGGSALVYDEDIAERLCAPAQLRDFQAGVPRMLRRNWLELQTRALYHAWFILRRHAVFAPAPCPVTE